MCGISGFLDITKSFSGNELSRIVADMANALQHRGPDDAGGWVDPQAGIALGHRRLSIIDLSPAGHQPMESTCGRYVIVYNGEVYNFLELKKELETEGYRFRGDSDTEVILAAVSAWGITEAVARFNGMFAFALWDKEKQTLHLARDRVGIKPLYYGWQGKFFLFASEMKAFRRFPGFSPDIDRDSLCLFLRHNYIPAPYSIYKGFYKLQPGNLLEIDRNGTVRKNCYWSAKEIVKNAMENPFEGSEEEAVEQLESLLKSAVKQRMVSDVPLGAFLSGGIDSSTVVALMQAQSLRPVKTFSIGFYEKSYNEAVYAKKVAEHLHTDHTELYVRPQEAMDVIPRLPEIYDEPFSDSSQIPTFLVSCLTRRYVTVSLSGDGGDELFAGYNRYFWGKNIWKGIGWLPKVIRKTFLAKGILRLPTESWNKLFCRLAPFLPKKFLFTIPGDKLHKLARILDFNSPDDIYYGLVSDWKNPELVVKNGLESATVLTEKKHWPKLDNFVHRMQYLDLVTYLPDDILTKIDRASMAVSLEARVPLLDHRIVEFAWRIPFSMKIKAGKSKWILRKLLYRYVPKNLIERPKMGFGIPLADWLRRPLREWAEELLREERLKREGFFNPRLVREKWEEHVSGQRDWHYYLWDVLMFQAWLEKNKE